MISTILLFMDPMKEIKVAIDFLTELCRHLSNISGGGNDDTYCN